MTALASLQELPLPAAVSYAPQTIGWAVVALVLLALALFSAWLGWRRYEKQRYRRVALEELKRIEAQVKREDERNAALAAIAPLIKRTALAVAPRERVASLSGAEWLAFLASTRGHFDARTGALLAVVSYAPPGHLAAISLQDADALISHTRDWIAHHHVEV